MTAKDKALGLATSFNKTLVKGDLRKAMKASEASRKDMFMVPVDKLRVIQGFNARVDNDRKRAHIENIAASMQEEGFYLDKPIAGYVAKEGSEDVIYITDGHCRMEAVALARARGCEIDTVPVVVSTKPRSLQDLTVALVRTNSGLELTAFEKAVVAKRLAGYNWEMDKIANRLGVTIATIKNYMLIMGGDEKVQMMVANGEVGLHTACELLRSSPETAAELLATARAKKDPATKHAHGKKLERGDVVIPNFQQSIKKAAPKMFSALNALRSDLGYGQLSEETRMKVDELVAELEARRSEARKAILSGEEGAEGGDKGGSPEESVVMEQQTKAQKPPKAAKGATRKERETAEA